MAGSKVDVAAAGGPPRATGREWAGLAVLALPTLLVSMDLTVLRSRRAGWGEAPCTIRPISLRAVPTPEPLESGHHDIRCSFCDRHNEHVRVVAHHDVVICQVCVARCAEIFDEEVGVISPSGGWSGRWPMK
jgi:hypothetical protein